MDELQDPLAMRAWSRAARRSGQRVSLVPTMGYLHEGHLRLLDRARGLSAPVVMSVFVNPLQFGPQEDFARYPRDLERDRGLARSRGAACLFVPTERAMYPRPPAVRVVPGPLADHLCGPFRPGHFEGVLTVVAQLFHIVEPDVAVFGRKDAQQARIIARMVDDLHLGIEIVVGPTVREPDGLALSSRNAYLNPPDRATARALSAGLEAAHRRFRDGEHDAAAVLAAAHEVLAAHPDLRVEYLEAVDPDALAPLNVAADDTLIAVAARLGRTRLIDNVVLGDGLGGDDHLPEASTG